MANVRLENVCKSFGKNEVIHRINCRIHHGEFVVILGPSGCGKSTALRMIAGLEKVSDGNIFIDGQRVNQLEPAERDIAMVFQNYALYPHMTVYKNMAYCLKIRGMSKKVIQQRVVQVAEMLELTNFLDRKPRELSGGQRQRVAMGRCIVREPKVFLFDEPLSNLDAKLRVQMRLELKNLHERLGITSIYVTHDQVEAMTLGDRMIVMNQGKVEQIGSPLDVYEHPASLFVAGFIGSPAMNILEAQVSHDAEYVELPGNIPLKLPGNYYLEHAGQRVFLGIRPEHLKRTNHSEGSLSFRIGHTEILGSDTLAYGGFGREGTPLVVRLPHSQHLTKGSTFNVGVPSEDLHLFHKESGQRLQKKRRKGRLCNPSPPFPSCPESPPEHPPKAAHKKTKAGFPS